MTATPPTAIPTTVDEPLRELLSSGHRPRSPGALSVSITFGWRAMLKIKHVPSQLFDVTVHPLVLTLTFTYLFGGALAGSTDDYLQYLLPGILVMTILMITMYTGTALNTDVTNGIFDRFRALPIWRPGALVGGLLGDVVRYTIASILVIALGLILGFRPEGNALDVVAAVALILVFSFSVSWIWTALGLIMATPQSVHAVSMTLVVPLSFASNIFVDPATMPSWLRTAIDANPITHLATAVRGLMHGSAPAGDIVWVLVASAAFTAVFGSLTMALYRNKS